MNENLEILAEKLEHTDAIMLGIGSGLSSAAGYNHYHWTPAMMETLAPFQEKYGFTSPFGGFYHCFGSYEEQWGYYSQYIRCMQETPTGKPYQILADLVKEKPHFVLTTNIDGQVQRVFEQDAICSYQGDFSYLQCSQPCEDILYPNQELIRKMTNALDEDLKIPTELVPRCEHCGRVLVPWVRDDTFLEGKEWKAGIERYHAFLQHWLLEQKDKKLLLLEIGIGEMTPSIIKLPFWEMTEKNENVFYACMNQEKTDVPLHLKDRGIYIQGDLRNTLHDLEKMVQERRNMR